MKLSGLKLSLLLSTVLAFSSSALAGTLTIINGSTSDLSAVYISDSGTNSWEENLIPDGYVLPSGNQIDVTIQGQYNKFDLRVESTEGGAEDYFEFPGNVRTIELQGNGNSQYQ